MQEFDIEKVESLDYDTLSTQLEYIFKEEKDITNFINFLKSSGMTILKIKMRKMKLI